MAKLKEELWNILRDLSSEDFEHFKWFLNHNNIIEGCKGIPVAQLEKAERQHVVDLMVQTYQGPGALTMTMTVLEKINRNDLVECLQNSRRETKDLKNHERDALTDKYETQKAKLGVQIKLMIQERQMKIGEIKRSAELCSKSADRHITDSEQAYATLLRTLKESLDELIKSINQKRKTTQKQAEEIINGLEQEISELTKRSADVEKLSPSKDHLNFAQSFAFLSDIPPTKNWTEVHTSQPSYGGSVAFAVNEFEKKLIKQREDFVNKGKLNRVKQFAKDVTLDPDTAHPRLVLSNDGKKVHCGGVQQKLTDNSKRFLSAINVLGKQSISSGRFYCEIEVKGKTSWDLGVVKESIDRKGSINASRENGYWTIGLRNGETYQTSGIHLSVKSQPDKVGVFVDYGKHSVTFFDADTADIIHRFTDCSFSEKLYPFFSPGLSRCAEHSPLVITPVNY